MMKLKCLVLTFSAIFLVIRAQNIPNGRHRIVYHHNTTSPMPPSEVLLGRIYEQMKGIENLEHRLSRFEVTNHQKLEAVRNDIKELGQIMQNLESLTSKGDGDLNQLRYEINAIRHMLDGENLKIGKREDQVAATNSPSDLDCSEKLEALATLLTSTRAAVFKIERKADTIYSNVTNLLHSNREIFQRLHGIPTKQFLYSAVSTLRNPSFNDLPQGPVYRPSLPNSCAYADLSTSEVQKIQVGSREPFYALCDDETEGGGWTVIQNREDGTVNFNRNWLEYKLGFGNIAGEFFIGLDKLHDMTSTQLQELLIALEDFEGQKKYARYKLFAIAGEQEDYALRLLGAYEGNAGDSLSYSASYKFSTFDNDNDGWVEGNCALSHTGAWWFNACEMSNLNGQYLRGEVSDNHQFQGVYWNDFRGSKYSLKSVRMMIRPIDREFLSK